MSIATLAPFRPTSFAPTVRRTDDPNPAPAPAPTPDPTPADPAPDIDFSSVDTPAKAALLPALNGAAFLLTLNAVSNAAQAGAGLTSSLKMTLGQSTEASFDYALSADPNNFGLTGQGAVGGNAASDNWTFNQDGILLSGNIGSAQENIKVSSTANGLALDGTIGGVEVHETIANAPDGNGVIYGGTIGGQALNQAITVGQDAQGNTTLHAEGTLGDAAINYDETVTQNDNGMSLAGKGTIAGNAVSINHTLTFDFGQQTPDPGNPDGGNGGQQPLG